MIPFTVAKWACHVDDRVFFDCISLREIQTSNGTSLCILTHPPFFRLNEHCYFKFFLVGGSTLNKLGNVVARYTGGIRIYVYI